MARPLVALVLVLVVALAAWLLLWPAPGGALPTTVPGSGAPAAALPVAARDQEDASAQRIAAPDDAPQVVRVRVLTLHDDESPVPGAVVEFTPPPAAAAIGSAIATATATADAEGQVEIEAASGTPLVARSHDLYGTAQVEVADGPLPPTVRVVLRRDVTIRALVVGPDQRPCAGVDVEAEVAGASRSEGELVASVRLGASDPQGMVVLPHVQTRLPMPGFDVFDWALQLVAAVPGHRLAARHVTYAELTADTPVRLEVPATGTVEVEVLDADGRPLVEVGVELRSPGRVGWFRLSVYESARGRHVFRGLPLDSSFVVAMDCNPEPGLSREVLVAGEVPGPSHHGEVVFAQVAVPRHQYRLCGVLRRSDGIGLGFLRGTLIGADAVGQRMLTTDQHGRFDVTWVLPAAFVPLAGVRLELEPDPRLGSTTVEFATAFRPGDCDVGERIVPAPSDAAVLAVVDVRSDGRSLAGIAGAALRRGPTLQDECLPLRTREVGERLELRSAPETGPLWLFVRAGGHLDPAPVEIVPGQQVTVELVRGAGLAIPVRGPRIPIGWGARLVQPGTAVVAWAGVRSDHLYWDLLAPGRYTLQCVAKKTVFHEVEGIEVGKGQNVWPKDGSVLDLRTSARAIYVGCHARDEDGRDEQVTGVVVPAGAMQAPTDESQRERSGPFLLLRPQPVDLLFAWRGFVPVRLSNPTADTSLRLQPCTLLHLRGATEGVDSVAVHIAVDGVVDIALRQIDDGNPHADFTVDGVEDTWRLHFVPGTVLDLTVTRNGTRCPPQRVVVGATSPQVVLLR